MLKRSVKKITQASGNYLGYRHLASTSRTISDMARQFFIPAQPQHLETFEQAMQRLGLSEQDVQQRKRTFLSLSILFLIAAVGLIIYAIYLLLVHAGYLGFVVAVGAGLLSLSQAFRNHFWYFQIKKGQLGCSLRQWLKEGLLGNRL